MVMVVRAAVGMGVVSVEVGLEVGVVRMVGMVDGGVKGEPGSREAVRRAQGTVEGARGAGEARVG